MADPPSDTAGPSCFQPSSSSKKRPRIPPSTTNSTDVLASARNTNNEGDSVEHLSSTNHQDELDDVPQELPSTQPTLPILSLPILLAQREQGITRGATNKASSVLVRHRLVLWQRQILTRKQCGQHRHVFRDFCKRQIPFTTLGTPLTEAVLGLERNGSYCLTLGDGRSDGGIDDGQVHDQDSSRIPTTHSMSNNHGENNNLQNAQPCLVLRFYGIPSPSTLQSTVAWKESCRRAPRLLTIPLALRETDRLSNVPYEELLSWTVRIPCVFWMSSDWRMGVAWLRIAQHSNLTRHALVIFPLPTTGGVPEPRFVTTLRLDDANLNMYPSSINLKKAFWRVPCFPDAASGTSDDTLCKHLLETPGYLLLTREDPGTYRLTWIRLDVFSNVPLRSVSMPHGNLVPESSVVALVTPVLHRGWRTCVSDDGTGCVVVECGNNDNKQGNGPTIAGEARLHISCLLRDILRRRPKLVASPHSSENLPSYSCDIVAVSDSGTTMEVAICFDSGKKHTLYGVFVEIDIFSQSYRELKWTTRKQMLHSTATTTTTREPLETLCEILSLNRRMSQQRMGPYCIDPEPLRDWTNLCTTRSVEPDEWTCSYTPERWLRFDKAVDKIPYDAIYPHAQVFDNRAVMFHTPVRSLKGRSAAVELVYG